MIKYFEIKPLDEIFISILEEKKAHTTLNLVQQSFPNFLVLPLTDILYELKKISTSINPGVNERTLQEEEILKFLCKAENVSE